MSLTASYYVKSGKLGSPVTSAGTSFAQFWAQFSKHKRSQRICSVSQNSVHAPPDLWLVTPFPDSSLIRLPLNLHANDSFSTTMHLRFSEEL